MNRHDRIDGFGDCARMSSWRTVTISEIEADLQDGDDPWRSE